MGKNLTINCFTITGGQKNINSMKKLVVATVITLLTATSYSQNSYVLDKNHSKLSFIVMHFGISHVEGNFKSFDVTLEANSEDFTDAVIEMTADVKSINTEVEMRDKDLMNDNWFSVEKFPALSFKSTSFIKEADNNYKLAGNITIHGITKPIVFDVVLNGKALNPMTLKYSVGFTVTGKLNRNDFEIGTEPFAAVVGNEVDLKSNVEFVVN
jgi:polyisoprenoid-binding protein YceI